MSEAMKKHPTKDERVSIWIGNKKAKLYLIPKKKAKALSDMLEEYKSEESIPWRDVLTDLISETSQQAIVLRASRREKNLSQKKLAKILKVDPSFITQIEKGEKKINKPLAKKLAEIFNTDYRIFL